MPDRVDTELRRISTALAEVSPSKPDLSGVTPRRTRPPALLALASFVVVLGVGLVAGLVLSGDELPASGIVPVPGDHVANEVLELDVGPTEVPDLAFDMGFEFSCGAARGTAVQSCAIWEDGVAVVIPYSTRDGVTAEVSSPLYDGRLEIPFEEGEPVAVRHDTGRLTLLHYFPDEEAPMSFSSYFPASSAPDR